MKTSHIILALLALLALGGGAYALTQFGNTTDVAVDPMDTDTMPVEPDGGIGDGAEPLDELLGEQTPADNLAYASETIIGQSVDGATITAYHFGNGTEEILLIGGTHGSDAPNTTALANELRTYFAASETTVPANTRVTIIPTVNPDGLADGSRFNTNNVDLNRNFACDWSATSMWREQEVSGGTAAFSEPEAVAIRDYVAEVNVIGTIVWFAAEGKVYPSACEGVPSRASAELAATFATAAGYPADAEFDAYRINGDMVNWMAGQGIPAISVLLTNRTGTELQKNQAGVAAALEYLSAN
jgi:predicted deacylase